MKSQVILFFLILINIRCTNRSNELSEQNSLNPNGKGYIKFHSTAINDSIELAFWYITFLPFYNESGNIVTSDTLIEIDCKFPLIVNLINMVKNDGDVRFMILPGDTLFVSFKQQECKKFPECISFKGETESISKYLTFSKLNFSRAIPDKNEMPLKYNQRIDSFKHVAKNRLYEYEAKSRLPKWFIKYEEADIQFVSEQLKLVQYQHRHELYNQKFERKEIVNFYTDKVLSKNEWITDNLFFYLSTIRSNKYDTLLNKQLTDDLYLQYTQDNINKVRGKVTAKVMSYFVAAKLSHLIDYGNLSQLSRSELLKAFQDFDSMLVRNTVLISDTAALNFIKDYKDEQLNKLLNKHRLVSGDRAPSFLLKDINDKNVSLLDFKGKVVCLNFWNTTCRPCITSIPMKNKLCIKYGTNNFVLVNICTDNNYHKWRKIISANKFKGIHLRCKDNWAHTLTQEYVIESYPQYSLINPEGDIIKNKVPKDSLEYYIIHSL